jgi:hypothetical protein
VPTHLVQLSNGSLRRVAMVKEPYLHCLEEVSSVYELAQRCLATSQSMEQQIAALAVGEVLSYDDVYDGRSSWRLIRPIDVPGADSRLLVSGTGLTHIGSARQRQSMHLSEQKESSGKEEVLTDSMRMFQWGVEQGRPTGDQIGIAPEWFYKGDGASLFDPFAPLVIPSHAEDGGEEAELAGVYIISSDGTPFRIGITQGDEFSDHKFERRNYLNLAGSKLRACSVGPELIVGADFGDINGRVRIRRDDQTLWEREIASGETNMAHSLQNLEHHHFKFSGHRQPGQVHLHFFGADALSFGSGVILSHGDIAEVQFDGFGRPLQNPVHQESSPDQVVRVQSLA